MTPRAPHFVLLPALLALAGCNDDPTSTRDPAVFELELRNHIVQEGRESFFTPELIVVAADAGARFQADDVAGITVAWPDGTPSVVDLPFTEEDGRLQASGVDESQSRPLPDGTYEVKVRFDDGEALVFETDEEIAVLSEIDDFVTFTFADQPEAEIRWTAPPETHQWQIEVYRIIDRPGPQELVKILDVPGETVTGGGPQEARFSIEEVEPGEFYEAVLILTNEQNVRVFRGGGQRPQQHTVPSGPKS